MCYRHLSLPSWSIERLREDAFSCAAQSVILYAPAYPRSCIGGRDQQSTKKRTAYAVRLRGAPSGIRTRDLHLERVMS